MSDVVFQLPDTVAAWITALLRGGGLWEIGALLLILVVAWLAARAVRSRAGASEEQRPATSPAALPRLTFAAACALGALLGAVALARLGQPSGLLRMMALLAAALLAIRIFFYLLARIGKSGALLAASEQVITWAIWVVVAVLVLGWLQPVMQALDQLAVSLGDSRISLLDALSTAVTLLLFLAVAIFVGAVLERRVMSVERISIGLRVGIAKTARFGLILLAALVAIDLIGVDLAALAVFGGALGVGIGFGLQRIASNFISGFILIGDRSIRPGDVITIDDRFGVVRELRARYVVVRDRDGVDTLIPNETIITSQVINWSYADRAVRLKLRVPIGYQDNPRTAMQLMVQAAKAHARVERTPEPAGRVMGFGDNGIDLELRFWIGDPEDGVNNVRSDLYLAIWDAFEAHGITIPYPQRDVHVRRGAPLATRAPAEPRPA